MVWCSDRDNLTFKCANYNLHHINRHHEQCQLNCIRWTHTRILFCTYYMFLGKIILSEYTTDFLHFITSLQPNCLLSASLLPHPLLYLYTTHPVELSFLYLWSCSVLITDDWFSSDCRYIMLLERVACSCRICLGGYVHALLVQNLSWQPVLHCIFHSIELVITSYPVPCWILLVSSMCCDPFLLLYLRCVPLLFGM
jgi:hypothetical protein